MPLTTPNQAIETRNAIAYNRGCRVHWTRFGSWTLVPAGSSNSWPGPFASTRARRPPPFQELVRRKPTWMPRLRYTD